MIKLNEANIATRYPEDLATLQKNYSKEITQSLFTNTKEALKWIKQQF